MSDAPGEPIIRIVKSPAQADLEFVKMTAKEELGRLFEFELEARSENPDLKLEDFLGDTVTVELDGEGKAHRFFNGCVSRFSYSGSDVKYSTYHISLRPWLWLLTRGADCRIFQDRTVPEIVEEMLGEFQIVDFELILEKDYRRWDYLVQYRETAFNFLSRLMEQDGIYYYFRHEEGRHVLVFADALAAHQPAPVYEHLAPFASGEHPPFFEWRWDQEPQASTYVLTDFNYEDPRLNLEVQSDTKAPLPGWDHEVFDFPGEYRELGDGETYVRERLEMMDAQRERVRCESDVPGLGAGTLFNLSGHPRSDQNREYLVVSAVHELKWDPHFSGPSGEGERYRTTLAALPSRIPFRPPLMTPKAVVNGPQTAIVVGPKDQEVWTDEYGRIKVRFHWDRRGKKDGADSCWIRVSQSRAGSHWGAMELPHVGQEVVVDFLEGDPDRPIITGSVFNASNMPPLTLPKNRYKTVVARDHYGNEIVFDGTPGDEHVRIHSPHHKSRLILGRSCEANTISGDFKATAGSRIDAHMGMAFSAALGVKASFDLAPGVSVQTGHNWKYQFGRDDTWYLRDRAEDCREDYVIQVHGPDGKMSISAVDYAPWMLKKFWKIPREALHRSLVYLDKDSLQLSYGDEVSQGSRSWVQTGARGITLLALAAIMAAEIANAHMADEKKEDGDEYFSWGGGGTAALAGIISLVVALFPSKEAKAEKSDDEWNAKVELDKTGLALDSKKSVRVGFGDNMGKGAAQGIYLGNPREYEVREIQLKSKEIFIDAVGKLELWGRELHLM